MGQSAPSDHLAALDDRGGREIMSRAQKWIASRRASLSEDSACVAGDARWQQYEGLGCRIVMHLGRSPRCRQSARVEEASAGNIQSLGKSPKTHNPAHTLGVLSAEDMLNAYAPNRSRSQQWTRPLATTAPPISTSPARTAPRSCRISLLKKPGAQRSPAQTKQRTEARAAQSANARCP